MRLSMLGFLVKSIVVLAFLGGLFLIGYAYFGDLRPNQVEVVQPVTLPSL